MYICLVSIPKKVLSFHSYTTIANLKCSQLSKFFFVCEMVDQTNGLNFSHSYRIFEPYGQIGNHMVCVIIFAECHSNSMHSCTVQTKYIRHTYSYMWTCTVHVQHSHMNKKHGISSSFSFFLYNPVCFYPLV